MDEPRKARHLAAITGIDGIRKRADLLAAPIHVIYVFCEAVRKRVGITPDTEDLFDRILDEGAVAILDPEGKKRAFISIANVFDREIETILGTRDDMRRIWDLIKSPAIEGTIGLVLHTASGPRTLVRTSPTWIDIHGFVSSSMDNDGYFAIAGLGPRQRRTIGGREVDTRTIQIRRVEEG